MQGGKHRNKKGQFVRQPKLNDYLAVLSLYLLIPGLFVLYLITNTTQPAEAITEQNYYESPKFTQEQIDQAHAEWWSSQIPDPCELESVVCEGEKIATATVTAYTSELSQTDNFPCISADGSNICKLYAQGELICASNDYPIGTKLTIPDYGTCTVRDRMNQRYTGTGHIDIYYGHDTQRAIKWGARQLTITK